MTDQTNPPVTVDLASLTDEQQLALQQFTSVTDQDVNIALPLLRRCEFNVQIAIARFFDGEPPAIVDNVPPPTRQERTPRAIAHDVQTTRHSLSRTYQPAFRITALPDHQRTAAAPVLSILMFPMNFVYTLLSRLLSALSSFVPFLPRILERLAARLRTRNRSFGAAGRRQLGSQDSAARFIREFEEAYGSAPLPFLRMGYGQAFDLAKRELKFLVVLPLAPEHDDTDAFVRGTLLSDSVVSFFTDPTRNIVVWAGSMEDSETFQVANSLRITNFPATSIVAHTPSVSSTAMSVLKTLTGTCAPEEYVAQLQAVVTRHSPELDNVRSARAEQQATRSLREQQDSAYERSLATDRERARQRREAEQAQARQLQAAQEKAEREARYTAELSKWKQWRARKILNEVEPDAQRRVRVSIRLPDGRRVIRSFPFDAPIEDAYAFVECYELVEKLEKGDEKAQETVHAAEDFEPAYGFQLVTPLPREVHLLQHGGTIGGRLGRNANVIAEPIEESDGSD